MSLFFFLPFSSGVVVFPGRICERLISGVRWMSRAAIMLVTSSLLEHLGEGAKKNGGSQAEERAHESIWGQFGMPATAVSLVKLGTLASYQRKTFSSSTDAWAA